MKFTKGLLVGSMVTAGIMMMYSDEMNTKKMIKKGKVLARKMGLI